MERLIFHIDINSAFLSWEAARRVAEGLPDLREIPSAIGGDPEKRTGVVLAKSIPAKKYGIKTGNTAAKLRKVHIKTIGDLAKAPLASIQAIAGRKLGQQLHNYANGVHDSPVQAEPEEAKGYSISTTLEENVTDTESANRILLALADSVAARMRADDTQAACVAVTIRGNDFKNRSHQRQLYGQPTEKTKL